MRARSKDQPGTAGQVAAAGRPVVLIGPMAVGKSAIGRNLAQHRGSTFVDTDDLVVNQYGPIAEIFASRGEPAFREIEARAVAQTIDQAAGNNVVISLGGGAVLDSGTQQLLGRCTVVYLECDADTVADRIARNSARPLLAGDAIGRWQALFTTRKPVYERLADLVLDVRSGTVPELARQLDNALREYAAAMAAATPVPAATKKVD